MERINGSSGILLPTHEGSRDIQTGLEMPRVDSFGEGDGPIEEIMMGMMLEESVIVFPIDDLQITGHIVPSTSSVESGIGKEVHERAFVFVIEVAC